MHIVSIFKKPLGVLFCYDVVMSEKHQKRAAEIEPTSEPVLPVAIEGSNKIPSLEILYNTTEAKAPSKITKYTEPPKQPATPYEVLKQMGEQVFVDNVKPAPDTVKREEEVPISIAQVSTSGVAATTKKPEPVTVAPVSAPVPALKVDTVYRIQFYALNKFIPLDTNYYTHLKGYEVYEEEGFFKYLLGRYQSYDACVKYWKEQIQPRYKQSFIVKYVSGKRFLK